MSHLDDFLARWPFALFCFFGGVVAVLWAWQLFGAAALERQCDEFDRAFERERGDE